MQSKHKMFLDELHQLLKKYNITGVKANEGRVAFIVNGNSICYDEVFSFLHYKCFNSTNEPKFSQVAVDYRPEDLPELESEYSGDENFDD